MKTRVAHGAFTQTAAMPHARSETALRVHASAQQQRYSICGVKSRIKRLAVQRSCSSMHAHERPLSCMRRRTLSMKQQAERTIATARSTITSPRQHSVAAKAADLNRRQRRCCDHVAALHQRNASNEPSRNGSHAQQKKRVGEARGTHACAAARGAAYVKWRGT